MRRIQEENRRMRLSGLWNIGPQIVYAYWENFNDPRFLHLPIHRKTLKLLTWNICFLWLAVILYQGCKFDHTYFLAKKFIYILAPSLPLQSSPPELLRGCFRVIDFSLVWINSLLIWLLIIYYFCQQTGRLEGGEEAGGVDTKAYHSFKWSGF